MNPVLLARERAAELGALDPRPEPPIEMIVPTRLHRIVNENYELWIDPSTGRRVEPERD